MPLTRPASAGGGFRSSASPPPRSAEETPWSPWNPTGSPRAIFGGDSRDEDPNPRPAEETPWSPWNPTGSPRVLAGGAVDAVSDFWRWGNRNMGGGGGGGFVEDAGPPVPSYQEPSAGTDVDPFAELASVQAKLSGMAGQLDANYESRLAELREAYEFAETPEEQAQLAFMLENIEGQRSAGQQVIKNAYGQAIASSGQRASEMRGTAAQEGQRVGDLYRGAADRTAAGVQDVASGYEGSGLGVGAVPVTGDATDFVHQLNAAAPREQALTQRLGNIAAEDVAFLGQAMAGEQNAQTGDLERLAMQLAAQTQAQHTAAVNDRIAQERQMFAGQQFGLGNRHEDRRWNLEDTGLQVDLDEIRDRRMQAPQMVPSDPRERYLWGAQIAAEQPWMIPVLIDQGVLPPDFDASMVPGYVPPGS